MKKNGITVQCVSCKTKKLLTFEEASALEMVPMCDKCFMPMIATKAELTNARHHK